MLVHTSQHQRSGHTSHSLQLIADGLGNVFAAWWETTPLPTNFNSVWVSRHTPGGSWTPQVLELDAGNVNNYQEMALAANAQGEAAIVWLEDVLSTNNTYKVRVETYFPGSGWSAPMDVNGGAHPSRAERTDWLGRQRRPHRPLV